MGEQNGGASVVSHKGGKEREGASEQKSESLGDVEQAQGQDVTTGRHRLVYLDKRGTGDIFVGNATSTMQFTDQTKKRKWK